MEAVEDLSPEDGAATLTAFTAASLARAREHFPEPAATWIVCGGGRHNKFLMDQLRARVNAPVISAEMPAGTAMPWKPKALPIWRCVRKRACRCRLPTTTGVKQPMTGGKYHRIERQEVRGDPDLPATGVAVSGLRAACSSYWRHIPSPSPPLRLRACRRNGWRLRSCCR